MEIINKDRGNGIDKLILLHLDFNKQGEGVDHRSLKDKQVTGTNRSLKDKEVHCLHLQGPLAISSLLYINSIKQGEGVDHRSLKDKKVTEDQRDPLSAPPRASSYFVGYDRIYLSRRYLCVGKLC